MAKIEYILAGETINEDDIIGNRSGNITFGHGDDRNEVGTSTTLTLKGRAAEIVEERIVKLSVPQTAPPIPVILRINCCGGLELPFSILAKDVSYCEIPCREVKVKLSEASQTVEKLDCLKNVLIWDRESPTGNIQTNGEDESKPARYSPYCLDIKPKVLHFFMIYMSVIVNLIIRIVLGPIALIITVINFIIDAINLIPGVNIPNIDIDGDDTTNTFDELRLLTDAIERFATGCGYKHKTPFFYAYLMNISKLCGLVLKAPDFEPGGKFHNCMRLDAQDVEGGISPGGIENAYLQNRPNINGLQFLNDHIAPLGFDWFIDGCTLCIASPSDNVRSQNWFNILQLDDDDVESLCFEFSEDKTPAYFIPEYCQDGLDLSGDEVRACQVDTVIDWNDPPNIAQSGAQELTLPYSATQFRSDKCRPDTAAIDSGRISTFDFLFPSIRQNEDVMLISKGKSNKPKILCWDGVNDADNCAKVERRIDPATGLLCYNEKVHIKESGDNFYTCALGDQNPRNNKIPLQDFTLILNNNCKVLSTLSADRIDNTIGLINCGKPTVGIVKSINVSLDSCKITIKGKS